MIKPPFPTYVNRRHLSADGIISAWLFNDNPQVIGPAFDIVGGNHGTLVGDVSSTGCKFGNGLDFPGVSDYVNCGDIDLTELTDKLTVLAWARRVSGTSGYVVSKRTSSAVRSWHIDYDNGTEDLHFVIKTSSVVQGTFTNGIASADEDWHQLVGVYDGVNVHVYIDGVADPSPSAQTGDINDTAANVLIGARQDGTSGEWTGAIDHVIIWNRALAAQEIEWLYRKPFDMFERIPIELWVGSVGAGAPPSGNPWYVYASN